MLTDTGYQGLQKLHKNSSMPKKKSKKHPLSNEDKRKNRELSKERVLNENVIGMLKRFKIICDRYRNRRKRFMLRFNLISAIYNLELDLWVSKEVYYLAESYSLKYLHTKEKQEVDFALACDNQIVKIIEVKYADSSISPHLRYFHEKYNLPAVQVVKELKRERTEGLIEVVQGATFLKSLYL